jgi:hypothetical protein
VKRLVRSFGVVVVLSGALGVFASTQLSAATGQTAVTGSLSGAVSSSSGQAIPNAAVQLRNLATGQLSGTTTSNGLGHFSFVGLNAGSYAVEVVNASGEIVGTSAAVSVPAGGVVTGVGVTASAAIAAAGGGVGTAPAKTRPAGRGTGASTAAIIGAAAAAAGVAGAAYTNSSASPSQ